MRTIKVPPSLLIIYIISYLLRRYNIKMPFELFPVGMRTVNVFQMQNNCSIYGQKKPCYDNCKSKYLFYTLLSIFIGRSKMKRLIIKFVFVVVFVVSSSSFTYAMDSRVSASSYDVDTGLITAKDAASHSAWTKGYYKGKTYGFVTSTYKHYANAELLLVGAHIKYSGRKWGTGKVSVNTDWGYSACAIIPNYYGGVMYYGF
jgi:hypothetical protein